MDMKEFFSVLFTAAMGLVVTLHAKDTRTSLEESLQLRRIAAYWKEKDYSTVKIQISTFLERNPDSTHCDQLYAMLGDIEFQKKNYENAVLAYDKIRGQEFGRKTCFHRLHSLYETESYDELIGSADRLLGDPNATADQIATIRFELAEAQLCMAHAQENRENKKELMKAALSRYNQIMETKFADMALFPKAQIYAFLEEYSKAAPLYLMLARKDAAKKEEYLFQAGCMQLHGDKKAAISTFGSIAEMGGKYAPEAAFNQLTLLYQEKLYREFVLAQDKVLRHIPPDKMPWIQYCLGKSLLHMCDHAAAIAPLTACLSSGQLDRSQEMGSLVALMICAKETDDLPLFEKYLEQMKAGFPQEPQTQDLVLLHAQLCRDKKQWKKAREGLEVLLELSPHHQRREEILHDRALTLIQEGNLLEGASAFEQFLKEFPESFRRASVLRHLISAHLEVLKAASNETLKIKQQLLLDSLQLALQEKVAFPAAEKQKMRYLAAQTQYALGLYREAIDALKTWVRDYPEDPLCADAWLMIAQCHRTGLQDATLFCLNAEKALALRPQLPQAIDLHLTLYNTFLELAEKAATEDKQDLIAKAAHHLFLSLDKPVHRENQRWLAGYYFQQSQQGQKDALEKAAVVLEKLLGISEDALNFDGDAPKKEGEVLRLAEIYAGMHRHSQRAKLLEALVQEQSTHPELPWKYQRMAQFELGRAWLALNDPATALKTFKELISFSAPSYFAIAAQLESAKLEFSMLKPEDLHEESQSAMAVCDALKSVEIRRKLYSEPLHLEAALCYIDIKTALSPTEDQNSRRYSLLQIMKTNFSNQEDPEVCKYLSSSPRFPDKEILLRQYLAFVDAEMLLLDGQKNRDAAKIDSARSAFNQLLGESQDATLAQRIRQSMEASVHNL